MEMAVGVPAISHRLGQFATNLAFEAIPTEVRERARLLILDAVGCALAARRFDFSSKALEAIAELAGEGDSAVIGHALRLPLRDAVLANGLLAHGLDYDDTHTEAIAHLTVSVFPTALAVACERDLRLDGLLAAYVVGVEAGARIGAVAKGAFHQVGFHPTGVVGAFACALAAGRLYGLDAGQLAQAQGVALSVAAGSLEFLADGAWTKRFHPGWAGVGGIVAAAMARRGFVAPAAPYEGRFGLYATYLGRLPDASDLARATEGLGDVWETTNVAVKPFPACHFAHAFADAAIALHKKDIRSADVRRIVALVPEEIVKTVCEPAASKRRPANDYDAKFSIPYIVAACLLRGRFGLAELDDAALEDPAILALAAKVEYEIDPDTTFPRHYTGEVIVETGAGIVRHREAVNRGSADRPLSRDDIVAKFMDNARHGTAPGRAAEIRDAILESPDKSSARRLADVLGRP